MPKTHYGKKITLIVATLLGACSVPVTTQPASALTTAFLQSRSETLFYAIGAPPTDAFDFGSAVSCTTDGYRANTFAKDGVGNSVNITDTLSDGQQISVSAAERSAPGDEIPSIQTPFFTTTVSTKDGVGSAPVTMGILPPYDVALMRFAQDRQRRDIDQCAQMREQLEMRQRPDFAFAAP